MVVGSSRPINGFQIKWSKHLTMSRRFRCDSRVSGPPGSSKHLRRFGIRARKLSALFLFFSLFRASHSSDRSRRHRRRRLRPRLLVRRRRHFPIIHIAIN